ncbi:MAG: ribosome biogenesis GTPase YlqF [Clostridia bacterium]
MHIHWFPGHMTKAIRMMEAEIKLVDSVIYVLDARAPLASINPAFDAVIGHKPRLYVINKGDLVERAELLQWVKYFEGEGVRCITANSVSKADAPSIIKNLTELNAGLIERYRARGVTRTVRAMVIGVPNSGKSTLINSLVREKKAATGNRPGVTRGKQWVSIDRYIELLDSPGVLYPDFKDQKKAVKLALIGSIKDDILDIGELALEAIKFLQAEYPNTLEGRYSGIDESGTPLEVMDGIAQLRGYLLRGGEIDYDRCAQTIITDFRKGYLGKIILEKASAVGQEEQKS